MTLMGPGLIPAGSSLRTPLGLRKSKGGIPPPALRARSPRSGYGSGQPGSATATLSKAGVGDEEKTAKFVTNRLFRSPMPVPNARLAGLFSPSAAAARLVIEPSFPTGGACSASSRQRTRHRGHPARSRRRREGCSFRHHARRTRAAVWLHRDTDGPRALGVRHDDLVVPEGDTVRTERKPEAGGAITLEQRTLEPDLC